MSLLRSKKFYQSNWVSLVLGGLLASLLVMKLPYDLHTTMTSVPARIVWTVFTAWLISTHGLTAGILSALVMIVLLTDTHVEGMENNKASTDPVSNAIEKGKQHSVQNMDLPPPSKKQPKEEEEKDEPIETKVANANKVGQLSLVDQDHAMKVSAIHNSRDTSVVDQMKKERETEQTSKEGFEPIGFGTNDLIKSPFMNV